MLAFSGLWSILVYNSFLPSILLSPPSGFLSKKGKPIVPLKSTWIENKVLAGEPRGVEFPSDPTDPLNKRTANRPCSIGMAVPIPWASLNWRVQSPTAVSSAYLQNLTSIIPNAQVHSRIKNSPNILTQFLPNLIQEKASSYHSSFGHRITQLQ